MTFDCHHLSAVGSRCDAQAVFVVHDDVRKHEGRPILTSTAANVSLSWCTLSRNHIAKWQMLSGGLLTRHLFHRPLKEKRGNAVVITDKEHHRQHSCSNTTQYGVPLRSCTRCSNTARCYQNMNKKVRTYTY